MNKSTFVSIILARGGSKGIPKKNLSLVNKKPLIHWSIFASLESKYIKETYVSSDSEEILSYSAKSGARIIKRPKILASDNTSSADSLEHAVLKIKKTSKADYVVLLQPTSPLRTSRHIDKACVKILNDNSTSLISVEEIENKYLKLLTESNEGYLEDPIKMPYSFSSRQSLPKTFLPNGAIYIVKLENFLKTKIFLGKKTSMLVMDKNSSIDIDDYSDIKAANKMFLTINK
tara:strand:+ start:38 stop:733 length:696 start_codon:yes stop_codon:yes gene_type:complete